MGNSNNIVDVKANEIAFQDAYQNWETSRDKIYWWKMWECVQKACANVTRSIYKKRGVIVPDEKLEDVVTDATAYCMRMIKEKKTHPAKLSSYVYLRCICFVNNKKDMEYNTKIVDTSAEDLLAYRDKIGEEI